MSEQNNEQKQNTEKVEKKFSADLSFMTAVLGGEQLFSPTKLDSDELKNAISLLAKDEKEKKIKQVIEKAQSIIAKKRAHDANVKELEKEFKKKKAEGMKVFSSEVDSLKRDIEDIKNIEKSYIDTLSSAADGKSSLDDETKED